MGERMETVKNQVKSTFFQSLQCGTGEAFLLLKQNPQIDFSALILKGAMNNYAIDSQSEGSRARYIFRLILASAQKDKIIRAVLSALQAEKYHDGGLYQMCDLAAKFYKAGYLEAKTALYARFEKSVLEEDYDLCGEDQIIELDGMDGLLKVADVKGRLLRQDPAEWEDGRGVDQFRKRNRKTDVYRVLESAGKENPCIQAYLDAIRKNKRERKEAPKTRTPYPKTIQEAIRMGRWVFIHSKNVLALTEDEVLQLAHEFLTEKDPKKKEMYLRVFSHRKFPLDYQPIFRIVKGRNSPKTSLTEYAARALTFFRSDDIRQFALHSIRTKRNPHDYLFLLTGNYEEGDEQLLTEVVSRSDHFDFIHSLAEGLIEIYSTNPNPLCKAPLELMYRKMNCGIHREDIIQILIQNGALSPALWRELPHDSYTGVRALARRGKKNPV